METGCLGQCIGVGGEEALPGDGGRAAGWLKGWDLATSQAEATAQWFSFSAEPGEEKAGRRVRSRPQFLLLGTVDIWERPFPGVGLSWALWGVEWHPWPPPAPCLELPQYDSHSYPQGVGESHPFHPQCDPLP